MKRLYSSATLIALLCTTMIHALSPKQRFVWDWRHTHGLDYERTLAKSTVLTANDKAALRLAVAGLVAEDDATEPGKTRATVLKELFAGLRVLPVHLSGDGSPEVIVQPSDPSPWCGATGNCTFWVFRKTNGRFEPILDSRLGNGSVAVETFNILRGKTMGYSDLVLGSHESARETHLFVYKFDGQKYQPQTCYEADWQVYDPREISYSKGPIITRCDK